MHPTDVTLNEFVDAALGRDEHAAVARHLESCAACRQLVSDLREIGRAAAALEPIEPPARVWTQIERAMREGVLAPLGQNPAEAGSHGSMWASMRSTGTWLAAAAVLVLAVFIGIRFAPFRSSDRGMPGADETIAGTADGAQAAEQIAAELKMAEEHYQKAIAGLEQIAAAERATFDPETAATLQKNLAVINEAISESRAAVRAQPQSEPAQQSLIENFKTKLALLQDTVALINELRAGNDAAAARIISGS
jgi:hypothetical protein